MVDGLMGKLSKFLVKLFKTFTKRDLRSLQQQYWKTSTPEFPGIELVGGPSDGSTYISFVYPPVERMLMKSDDESLREKGLYVIYEKVSDTRYKFAGYGPASWEVRG